MNLSNINNNRNNAAVVSHIRGFTIVELLIVIVVIGILAAIVIVAYNGVQNRGKLAAAQAATNTVIKKAEAANAIKGIYPQVATDFSAQVDSSLANSGITTVATAPTTTSIPTKPATVLITPCTGTAGSGGVVTYWDYSANTTGSKSYGQPTATGTCAAQTPIAAAAY